MKPNERACSVCSVENSLYKCKECSEIFYCSLACYKVHSELHNQTTDQRNDIFLSENSHTPIANMPDSECGEGQNSHQFSDQNTDNDGLLTLKQMHALSVDTEILNKLKSNELRELIHRIDKSRSRLDALETAEYNIPEFAAFVEHIAKVLFESR